jgi:hypothetical protein
VKAIAITTIIIINHGVGSNGGRFWRGKNSSYLLICISCSGLQNESRCRNIIEMY